LKALAAAFTMGMLAYVYFGALVGVARIESISRASRSLNQFPAIDCAIDRGPYECDNALGGALSRMRVLAQNYY